MILTNIYVEDDAMNGYLKFQSL